MYAEEVKGSALTTRAREALDIAMELSPEERASIVDQLLRSLHEPDPEIMAAWMEEAHRRMEAYDRGEMETYSEEEVFAEFDRICDSES